MNNERKIYGEGWLNFYVNWRFPIGFVLGAFSLIKEFIDAGNGGYLFVPIFFVLAILDVVVYFYRYVVYFAMRERTQKSYYMNIILLFVDSAYIALSAAQSSFSSISFWVLFPVEFIIACLIWALPNIVYFKHRKYLFGLVSSESNPRTPYATGIIQKESSASLNAPSSASSLVMSKTNDQKYSTAREDVRNIGSSISNPIFVCGEKGLKQYCASLRTEKNEPITWEFFRTYSAPKGEFGSVNDVGTVNAYKAMTGEGYYKTVYFSLNGTNNPTTAPRGFVLLSPREEDLNIGSSISNPVYVCGEKGLKQYCASLRTEKNEPITWEFFRTYSAPKGEFGSVNDVGTVNAYKAMTGEGYYKTVYFSLNGTNNPTSAPRGFIFPSFQKDNEQRQPSPGVVFCRKCGAQLIEGSTFCRKCGAPISTPDAQKQKEKTNTFVRPPVDTETPKNKSVSASGVQQLVEESKPKPVFEIDLLDKALHPKIRRASIFAEDAEWEKAEASLEAVLDEDPTNAYAYIGKLLVDFKVSKTSDLVDFVDVLPENKNYQKAIRFADEKLMRMLMALQKPKGEKTVIRSDSRVPIQVNGGTIWVSSEIAEKIASGEIDPNRELTPEEREAGEAFLRQQLELWDKKRGEKCI